jgi:16S rRNA (adenine1518-N6/adenine1519-N6)-dimethyltransferase
MRAISDGLPPLREVIATFGVSAKKNLGQNFLLDFNLTRKVALAAGPLKNATIYEVGPGPGGLTRALLAEGADRVIAIERDQRCAPALDEIARVYSGRFETVLGDAMAIDERELLCKYDARQPIRVAANLPYNLATALLIKWLTASWPPFWSSLTLMFQREVAERLVAAPCASEYGRLSILTQWRTRPRLLFDINRRAFTPVPNVTSSLVRIEPLAQPVAPARIEDLERVTSAAFGQRRKMLRQSLKQLATDPDALFRETGIDPRSRPQDIDVPGFAALARSYRKMLESDAKNHRPGGPVEIT